jgi:hypothetical protein
MSRINIVPADAVVKLVTSFTIQITNIELFNSAYIIVFLYGNESENPVGRRELNISGQDYLDCNNNDQYIVNLICKKLGFTQLNSLTGPTPVIPSPTIPSPTIPSPTIPSPTIPISEPLS